MSKSVFVDYVLIPLEDSERGEIGILRLSKKNEEKLKLFSVANRLKL